MQDQPMDAFYKAVDENTPGRDVSVGSSNLKVRVFPVKFAHFEPFVAQIEAIVRRIYDKAADPATGRVTEENLARQLGTIVPEVLNGLSAMVAKACVAYDGLNWESQDRTVYAGDLDLRQLPFHKQCEIVAGWLEESFMGEKLRPLASLIESLVFRTTGRKLSLSTLLSRLSSNRDTASTTSTNADATGGLTEVGASLNTDAISPPAADYAPPL